MNATKSHGSDQSSVVSERLLRIILCLLPLVLAGFGFYFVSIPENAVVGGVPQRVWFGVGQSVLASALVSLVTLVGVWAERISRREADDKLHRILSAYQDVDAGRAAGIRRIHDNRYIRPEYQLHQSRVAERLDVLGMSLKHLQQDIGATLEQWVAERPRLTVRIIVLNPTSPYCDVRDAEEGTSAGEIATWALKLTNTVLKASHPRLKIRWNNTLPTVSMYRLDGVMFCGPYLIGRLSRLTTTLEVEANGPYATQFLEHFESLWNPPSDHSTRSQEPTADNVETATALLSKRRRR